MVKCRPTADDHRRRVRCLGMLIPIGDCSMEPCRSTSDTGVLQVKLRCGASAHEPGEDASYAVREGEQNRVSEPVHGCPSLVMRIQAAKRGIRQLPIGFANPRRALRGAQQKPGSAQGSSTPAQDPLMEVPARAVPILRARLKTDPPRSPFPPPNPSPASRSTTASVSLFAVGASRLWTLGLGARLASQASR
jgi:hypothetical protein